MVGPKSDTSLILKQLKDGIASDSLTGAKSAINRTIDEWFRLSSKATR